MSNGTEVYNQFGALVIDGGFRNFRIFHEGTILNPSEFEDITFTPAQDEPYLVLAQPGSGNWVGPATYNLFPNNTECRVLTYTDNGAIDMTVPHFLAGMETDIVDADTHGMQVFDADGSVVFDSRYRYLIVHDVVTAYCPGDGTVNSYAHANVPNAFYSLTSLHNVRSSADPPPMGSHSAPYIRQSSDSQLQIQRKSQDVDMGGYPYLSTDIIGPAVPTTGPYYILVCTKGY